MSDDATILRIGASGDDVTALQRRLNASGASPVLEVDGHFGPDTQGAVEQAQRLHALPVTGAADQALLDVLDPEPPSTVPFVQAHGYNEGRATPISLIVLHTTENDCAPGVARAVAYYFASAAAHDASAHYVVGPDEAVGCVHESDTAWHAPPVNVYSLGIEHTARAAFTPAQWATDEAKAMLARSAALVAELCKRYGIPITFVDADGLRANRSGITTHVQVTEAFHKTDHTDPGPNWPMSDYLAAVASAAT